MSASLIDEFPLSRHELSPEWVARCMTRAGLDVEPPLAIEIESLPEIGQTADAFIIHLDLAPGTDPAVPRSVFAKVAPRADNHRLPTHDLGLYARELSFYRDFGQDPGIPIPRVYFANLNPDSGHFFLLLENLHATHRQGDMWRPSLADVEAAVRYLAGFHAHWWQHARVLTSRWLGPNDALNHFESEVEPMLPTLSKLLGRKYGTAYTDYLRYVVEHLGQGWARAWSSDPISEVTLLHGDYHPKELFFRSPAGAVNPAGSEVVATDWQAACVGSPGVDLHRVLLAGLEPGQVREHQEGLLDLYHRLMGEQGVSLDRDALRTDTRRSMLFAVRNWLFSVAFTDSEVLERSAAAAGTDFRQRLFGDFAQALEHNRIHELVEAP